MKEFFYWIALILLILPSNPQSNLSLYLNSTNAILENGGETIVLKLKVIGGTGPYTILYQKIPLEWSARGNDLVLSGVTPTINRIWTFDIIVHDSRNVRLVQTVKLFVHSYQIKLSPITVGKISYPSSKNPLPGIFKIISGPSSNSILNSQTNNGLQSSFNLQEIINQYPGSSSNKNQPTTTGFNINYN